MRAHEWRVTAIIVDLCLWALVIGIGLALWHAVKEDAMHEFRAKQIEARPALSLADSLGTPFEYDSTDAVAPPAIPDSVRAKMLRRMIRGVK